MKTYSETQIKKLIKDCKSTIDEWENDYTYKTNTKDELYMSEFNEPTEVVWSRMILKGLDRYAEFPNPTD